MTGYVIPLTLDPWQVFTMDVVLDGEAFHAQVEIRYLPAPDQWFVSIWDHSCGELLVNMIPLICSYSEPNDLLFPLRHLREGKGLGSLFCFRGVDNPATQDPAGNNLTDFQVVWSDIYD